MSVKSWAAEMCSTLSTRTMSTFLCALTIILQLHRDLCRYSEKGIGGSFKNTQNYISATDKVENTFVLFMPLPPYETPEAIEMICDSYSRVIDAQDTDPLILISVVIYDFLCVHPSNDGSGRMSRLLTTLLLYRARYHVEKYTSLESKIENLVNCCLL